MKKKRTTQVFYWDSSVFLALLNDEPRRAENIEQIIDEAEAGEVYIITSSFTLVEVIKLKGEKPILVSEQEEVTNFSKKIIFDS